jgi:hypothetical protein
MIHIVSKKIDGFTFSFYGFGTGHLSSSVSEIEVCGKKHSDDYKKVTKWIDTLTEEDRCPVKSL